MQIRKIIIELVVYIVYIIKNHFLRPARARFEPPFGIIRRIGAVGELNGVEKFVSGADFQKWQWIIGIMWSAQIMTELDIRCISFSTGIVIGTGFRGGESRHIGEVYVVQSVRILLVVRRRGIEIHRLYINRISEVQVIGRSVYVIGDAVGRINILIDVVNGIRALSIIMDFEKIARSVSAMLGSWTG